MKLSWLLILSFQIDPTRIWERYSLGETWYGRNGISFAGKKRVMLNNYKSLHYCDQCRCTCDQRANKNAVRSFYLGIIKPQGADK